MDSNEHRDDGSGTNGAAAGNGSRRYAVALPPFARPAIAIGVVATALIAAGLVLNLITGITTARWAAAVGVIVVLAAAAIGLIAARRRSADRRARPSRSDQGKAAPTMEEPPQPEQSGEQDSRQEEPTVAEQGQAKPTEEQDDRQQEPAKEDSNQPDPITEQEDHQAEPAGQEDHRQAEPAVDEPAQAEPAADEPGEAEPAGEQEDHQVKPASSRTGSPVEWLRGRLPVPAAGVRVSLPLAGYLLLAGAMAAGAVVLAVLSSGWSNSAGFAQLWLVPEQQQTAVLGVRNNFQDTRTFQLELSRGANVVSDWQLRLAPGESWQSTIVAPKGGPLAARLASPIQVLNVAVTP
jgi:hypothetical protein